MTAATIATSPAPRIIPETPSDAEQVSARAPAADPVYMAIAAHIAARAAERIAVQRVADLEATLPPEGWRTIDTSSEGLGCCAAHDLSNAMLAELVCTSPTTLAGACALLGYIEDTQRGPKGILLQAGEMAALIETLAEALPKLAGPA